jgi:hypothetical protein
MKTVLIALTLLSTSAFAGNLPKCNIENLKDAQKCMRHVAKTLPAFEEANDGRASIQIPKMLRVLKALDLKASIVKKATTADYIGFVLVHEDEHKLQYFVLNKGKNMKPQFLYELNVVDLQYDLKSAVIPSDIFLGVNVTDLDIAEKIQDYIVNPKEN